MKISVAFLLLVGAIYASGESEKKEGSTLAHQFFDYVKKVDAVNSLWKIFLKTPPSDEEKREEALNDFFSEHNRTLLLQFEWFSSLLTGDVTNPHLSLQRSLLDVHRRNLSAVEAALQSALETFKKAANIEFNVLLMTHANNEAGENLQKKIADTRETAEENTKLVVENYKSEGWKKYLEQDIQKLVLYNKPSTYLLRKITNFLKVCYPFRNWLVINYRSNKPLPYRFCLESRPFIHRYYHDKNTELMIVHSPVERRFGSSSEANLRLSRLTPSDWHLRRCNKKAGDIYDELEYKCGSKRHTAVLVVPTTTNELSYQTTNEGFVHQRTVQRRFPILCRENYNALIFG